MVHSSFPLNLLGEILSKNESLSLLEFHGILYKNLFVMVPFTLFVCEHTYGYVTLITAIDDTCYTFFVKP